MRVKVNNGGLLVATKRNISYSYYSYIFKKIYFKAKIRGGLFFKNYHASPGGPAGPPGSGKRVGISKTPAIGEKIRWDNDFFLM